MSPPVSLGPISTGITEDPGSITGAGSWWSTGFACSVVWTVVATFVPAIAASVTRSAALTAMRRGDGGQFARRASRTSVRRRGVAGTRYDSVDGPTSWRRK